MQPLRATHAAFGGWLLLAVFTAGHLPAASAWGLLPILILTVLVRRFNLGLYASDTFISLSAIGALAAGMLYGVPGAVIAATVSSLTGWALAPKRPHIRAPMFNLGAMGLSHGLAAAAFGWLDRLVPGSGPVSQVPGAVAAGALVYLGESAWVSLIVAFTQRRSPVRVWEENFRWLLPHWMGLGLVALGLSVSYIAAGLAGLLAFSGPALLMRYALKQYIDRTARSVEELSARNTELESANQEIAAMSIQLQETYAGTLEALVSALDARDQETHGHSARVSAMTMILARAMGVQEGSAAWVDIERGALLHDVGKIGVLDSILRKPGALTDEEWLAMRRHPDIGFDMLKDIPFLAGAAAIVAAHHERWDGKGYPRGLVGEEIPFGARLFQLADTFDAMASDRPYRRAQPYEQILEEIKRCAGSQFDPEAVAAFERVFPAWVAYHRESIARKKFGKLRLVG